MSKKKRLKDHTAEDLLDLLVLSSLLLGHFLRLCLGLDTVIMHAREPGILRGEVGERLVDDFLGSDFASCPRRLGDADLLNQLRRCGRHSEEVDVNLNEVVSLRGLVPGCRDSHLSPPSWQP